MMKELSFSEVRDVRFAEPIDLYRMREVLDGIAGRFGRVFYKIFIEETTGFLPGRAGLGLMRITEGVFLEGSIVPNEKYAARGATVIRFVGYSDNSSPSNFFGLLFKELEEGVDENSPENLGIIKTVQKMYGTSK